MVFFVRGGVRIGLDDWWEVDLIDDFLFVLQSECVGELIYKWD